MPTVDQHRQKLLTLLKELFQINQPDLDFGFYRIMHAKADQVSRFLDEDLLQIIADAFGGTSSEKQANLKKAYLDEIETARQYGVENPEESPKVKEAKARWDSAMDTATTEGEIYDHLYRFFERYYDNGDFLSKRYYARESGTKAAPYAVPYDGSEVYLHWANKDQYYIKTSEYFTDFTFDLSKAKEVEGQVDPLFAHQASTPMRVHFRIVDATEGEHGNIKAANGQKRYFILHASDPVSLENGELIIRFEYRPDPQKSGQDAVWQRKRMDGAVGKILSHLDRMKGAAEFARLLRVPVPTDKQKDRTLLAKYLARYTARNTMDYFIHKDLGGFLQRELDFYIKNEIMHLDDIEDDEAPRVEQYLSKIKVLRRIARKIIAFLAQLEDFQKKIWLKKKFIVDTNYCITLDRIPEILYTEIAANEEQCKAWIKLFAIDEIQVDQHNQGFSKPLTTEFLKANNKLVLDTRFFDESFKARLLASIENFDKQCDGLLIHSENFQALNLLQERYREQVKCVYIDPPYNTSDNAFLYKNNYKHSSWLSMMANRLSISPALMDKSSVLMSAIDDTEYSNLKTLLSHTFGDENYVGTIAAEVNPAGQNIRPNVPARSHDYFHIFAKNVDLISMILRGLTPEERKQYKEKDSQGQFYWDNLRRRGGNSRPTDRPKQWFPLFAIGRNVRVPDMEWSNSAKEWIVKETPNIDETIIWPIDPKGEKRIWRVNPDGARSRIADGEISVIDKAGRQEVSLKSREPEGKKPKTLWSKSKYSATSHGTKLLLNILGSGLHFSYPKSIHLTTDAIRNWADETALVLDFFAGSGTTGHSVINLNREDEGSRKYVLVEMGGYFETTLKPRIDKIIYSDRWKNGKPLERGAGISHCYKYLRLEGYEDTLNNLRIDHNRLRHKAVVANPSLKEDYLLYYLLDVETRGSHSLLNIDAFADPTAYTLDVKKSGTDEYTPLAVDLIETFNYLIGLRVEHIDAPQFFTAEFYREPDPELPDDKHTRLKMANRKQTPDGPWWFRKIEGWVPGDNGKNEKILIVWRKLTDDQEKNNLMLDEWFKTIRVNPRDFEYDTIYVNGSNNLPNLRLEGENWKVRLIEEDFMKRMWDVEDV